MDGTGEVRDLLRWWNAYTIQYRVTKYEYRCLSLFFLFLSPHPISLYTADLGIDANKGERAIDRVFMFFGLAIRLFDSYPTISSHLGGFASLRLC